MQLKLIILITCTLFGIEVAAQSKIKQIPDGLYYVVRHAEKDTGKNPVLTMAGYLRAGDLFRELKNKKIWKIYVSQYLRSQLTADSLRIYKNTDTLHYVADESGDDFYLKLAALPKREKNKKNVLIIAHSNTILSILKRLGITSLYFKEIPDHEYDNLFVVTVKNKKVSLKWLKYGKPSIQVMAPGSMKLLQ